MKAYPRGRFAACPGLERRHPDLAFHAVLATAEADGSLARVEEELFRFSRALAGQREVRRTLFDTSVPADARARLVEDILAGRTSPVTLTLAKRLAAAPRGRRYVPALGHLADLIAARRQRQVATVSTATPLSDAQRDRLAEILERAYGRVVQLNVVVDPNVLGGLRVQVGPQVVDATVLARLADARRRLAS